MCLKYHFCWPWYVSWCVPGYLFCKLACFRLRVLAGCVSYRLLAFARVSVRSCAIVCLLEFAYFTELDDRSCVNAATGQKLVLEAIAKSDADAKEGAGRTSKKATETKKKLAARYYQLKRNRASGISFRLGGGAKSSYKELRLCKKCNHSCKDMRGPACQLACPHSHFYGTRR